MKKITTLQYLAKSVQAYVVGIRHYLHANPELRFQEEKTLKLIRSEIEAMSFASMSPCRLFYGGIVFDLVVDLTFDWIIFRADIDALPLQEETGLPFASIVPGVAHACGHDTNVAMLLGVAKLIAEGEIMPKHNIRFVFQRAEENPITESGGAMLVREGVLKGISAAYALHIFTENKAPAGQFQTRKGGFLANSGRVKIEVACTGGHVASPHDGSNASDILADIIVGLRHFAITQFGPLEPVSFVPASVGAGKPDASNVRPGEATLWYAFRHLLSPTRVAMAKGALEAKIKAITSAYPDATVTVEHFDGHPELRNDPITTETCMSLLKSADESVVEIDLILGGEDFAHYLNQVPGCMMMLGAWQEGCGRHHTKTFNPDESILWKGVLYWLLLATN